MRELVSTVTGIGTDGQSYTINGYRRNGERLISETETSDGNTVHCYSERPLIFWIPQTNIQIHCGQPVRV